MRTVVCTSGGRLKERAREIGPWTQRLLLSLEAVGEEHDRIRGTPGLFGKLVSGLDEFCRSSPGEVTLWSNLTRENLDQIEEIARFAAEREIFVEFFPAARYAGYNDKIILAPAEREEAFRRVMELKRRGYPVHNTWYALRLMRSARPFRCNIPRLSVELCADGSIYACDPKMLPELEPYGSMETLDLATLRSSEIYRREWRRLRSCNRCLLPCVAHMANALLSQGARKAASQLFYSQGFFRYARK
jgi:MoaA/NifB/PqqE/SkfB family radical SAM enzyme